MTPNIKGLSGSIARLRRTLEVEVAPLMADIEAAGPDALAAIKTVKTHVAEVKAMTQDLKDFSASLIGSNGGPSLDDSQGSSETSEKPAVVADAATEAAVAPAAANEPAASWSGAEKTA